MKNSRKIKKEGITGKQLQEKPGR